MEPAAQARAEIDSRLWQNYPAALHPITIEPITSSGFSGGIVWSVRAPSGDLAVRMHGPHSTSTAIEAAHGFMTQARRLGWPEVPQPLPRIDSSTITTIDGGRWDVCTWQPGEPARLPIDGLLLRNAMHLIGRWHAFWTPEKAGSLAPTAGPNAVDLRRSEWRRLMTFDMPAPALGHGTPELQHLSARTRNAIRALKSRVEHSLQSLSVFLAAEPLVFCHGDLHREHILFTDGVPTGLIDLSCRWDYAAADLARWLSSVAESNIWPQAAEWYREKAPLSAASERAIPLLASTGLAIAALRWERWLVGDDKSERRFFPRTDLACRRWQEIVERLERLEL